MTYTRIHTMYRICTTYTPLYTGYSYIYVYTPACCVFTGGVCAHTRVAKRACKGAVATVHPAAHQHSHCHTNFHTATPVMHACMLRRGAGLQR